ncbi:MAG: Hsp70 family protein [Planctomycetota bacterium]
MSLRTCRDLPPRPDLIGRIEITFTLDANGILSAKARDVVSGKQSEMEVDYSNGISANQAAA